MPRSPLTERIKKVEDLVTQVLELDDEEYGYFLDRIQPEPQQEEAKPKRTRKKKTTAAPTKKRGLPTDAAPLLTSVPAASDEGEDEDAGARCYVCGHGEQYQDHYKPAPNYHEFKTAA